MTLRELIAAEIAQRGPIPFSRYMELCLFHPELGYYSRPQERFGKTGDFYTSSDVHAVFGRLLARQFHQMWELLGRPPRLQLIELGPGRGLFMRDVLDWSEKKFPDLFRALSVTLVERSLHLRNGLQERLSHHIAANKVEIAEDLMAPTAPAIIFANEFFDALPVEILDHRGQVMVTAEGANFRDTFSPAAPAVREFAEKYSIQPAAGERIEAGLAAPDWVCRLAASLHRGFVLIVDYGYTRGEQLAGRHLDTITTYRQHTAGHDPYEAPGEQDITAHVNFTALQAAAEENGLDALGLVTQSQFLLGIGEENQFADAFEDARLPQEHAKIALQLKHLATPAGMGESFHCLLLSRGVAKEKAARLSGLSFTRQRI